MVFIVNFNYSFRSQDDHFFCGEPGEQLCSCLKEQALPCINISTHYMQRIRNTQVHSKAMDTCWHQKSIHWPEISRQLY